MITKEVDEYGTLTDKRNFFIVNKFHEENFKELKEYINQQENADSLSVFYALYPVRPNKENYRPQSIMEVQIYEENEDSPLMIGWNRFQ